MRLAARSQVENLGDSPEFQRLERQVRELITKRELVMPVTGSLKGRDGAAGVTLFEMVRKDNGELFKKTVYNQALRLARLPEGLDKIYWQIGNEINNKDFSELVSKWSGSFGPAKRDDKRTIPYYAEFYFAPAIEGLRRASKEVAGVEDKIRVVLASVGGYYRPEAIEWLDALLGYTIKGDYAKSLSGKHVYELVDIISIHYLFTWDDASWTANLQELYRNWQGKGRIRGIWSTEEGGVALGKRNMGAYAALKVAARYMHWWGIRSVRPDSGRCFLWGWLLGSPGTRGDDAMRAIYDFVGSATLREIESALSILPESNIEAYLFESSTNPNKRVAIIFQKNPDDKLTMSRLYMKYGGWMKDISVSANYFSNTGEKVVVMAAKKDDDHYIISYVDDVSVSQTGALLLKLEQKTN